jgi:hypothetical protein
VSLMMLPLESCVFESQVTLEIIVTTIFCK